MIIHSFAFGKKLIAFPVFVFNFSFAVILAIAMLNGSCYFAPCIHGESSPVFITQFLILRIRNRVLNFMCCKANVIPNNKFSNNF